MGLKNSLGWRRKAGSSLRLKAPTLGWQLQAQGIKEPTPIPTGTSKTEPAIILLAQIPRSELEPDIPLEMVLGLDRDVGHLALLEGGSIKGLTLCTLLLSD